MRVGLRRRTFAALIDQDGVALVEYRHEKDGFRVLGARAATQRFETIEAAADAIVSMLAAERARNASLAIAIQHFGAFYHSMSLPPAGDEVVRPIIEREVQRVFNLADPVVAFSRGESRARADATRGGPSKAGQHIVIAGLPRDAVTSLSSRLAGSGVAVDILTVVPEALRRVYDAVDGSTETTALLVCLASGPHLAFFIDGRLELAIEPPIALEGERALDPGVIVDQVERGAVFLRQQARGAVAARLLLAAQPSEYASIGALLESRTRLVVTALAKSMGAPEAIVAMGAVLDARSDSPLDLLPRTPSLPRRIRSSLSGAWAVPAGFAAVAAAVAIWSGVQFFQFAHARTEIATLRDSISRVASTLAPLRESVERRAGVESARAALNASAAERGQLVVALERLAAATPGDVQLDSLTVRRTPDGWRASVRLHASAATGGEAIRGINSLYNYLQGDASLKSLTLGDSLSWSTESANDSSGVSGLSTADRERSAVRLSVGLSFTAPIEEHR